MALIHIEAEFAFRVCKEEFGLIKKKERIELYSIDKKKNTYLYQFVNVIMT